MGDETALRVGVVVASLGRPDELATLLRRLTEQSQAPSVIVLSVTRESDVPANAEAVATITYGGAGLPAQRNRGMAPILDQCDVVAFFDDDYIPSRFAIEGIARLFGENPDVVGATGTLLADGIGIGGISAEEGARLVDAFDKAFAPSPPTVTPRHHGLYGCNMAYRSRAVGALRFDEALPLYAWQEDMDFAALIRAHGRIVQSDAFVGVHCGVTKSRSPGQRLGYSQIANPTYLARKGTMTVPYALQLMLRNAIANHVKVFFPEPWIDRKGRMLGNWLALRDLLLGRLRPNRILEIQPR